jgi:pyruvate/2-oxoglutarate dehydrogenase complex dihydrolipoamide acyltransferase (E2) component
VAGEGNEKVFRKEALQRLSSPDELDHLVTVARPRAWLAFGAIALLVLVALGWATFSKVTTTVEGSGILLRGGGITRVDALSEGQIKELLVGVGDHVSAGQRVAGLDPVAQDGRSEVVSPYAGTVASLQVRAGQYVEAGAPVVTIEAEDEPLLAMLYVPDEAGKRVRPGMEVRLIPATAQVEEYGYLLGTVASVDEMPATPEGMMAVLQNQFLVDAFSAGGPPIGIEVRLKPRPRNPSGYAWSSSGGPDYTISSGTECSARIVLSKDPFITRAFPSLSKLLGVAHVAQAERFSAVCGSLTARRPAAAAARLPRRTLGYQ